MTTQSKIALITGGSRGLGKNMALHVAGKGIDVVITYNTQKEEADKVVAEIKKTGRKAAALQLNTGEVKGFDSFLSQFKNVLQQTFGTGRFDFLVNNAGVSGHYPIMDTTEEQFDRLLNIHFKGVFFLTQKLLPVLNDGGRIINISSGLARMTMPGASVYGSLKGAIEVMSRYMAKELGPRGIAVNTVAPGAIATDFSPSMKTDAVRNMVTSVTALGRVGEPEDIGPIVAFLCTEEARWVNAQRIEASGGMSL